MSVLPLPPFQFTLPRGERPQTAQTVTMGAWFQFTLPRGERPSPDPWWFDEAGFNSRSRVGSDFRRAFPCRWALLFQFTLPRGERPQGASLART